MISLPPISRLFQSALLSVLVAGLVGLAATPALGQVPMADSLVRADTVRIDRNLEFQGRLMDVGSEALAFQDVRSNRMRALQLDPAVLNALRDQLPAETYDVQTRLERTPGGVTSGIVLGDERGLVAVAGDLGTSTDEIRVEMQHNSDERSKIVESQCHILYSVPSTFIVRGQEFVLQPGETRRVEVEGARYELKLTKSQYREDKEDACPNRYQEGAPLQASYSAVRLDE